MSTQIEEFPPIEPVGIEEFPAITPQQVKQPVPQVGIMGGLGDYISSLKDTVDNAIQRGYASSQSTDAMQTWDANRIAANQKLIHDIPATPETTEVTEAQGIGNTLKAFFRDPLTIGLETSAESLAALAPQMVGTLPSRVAVGTGVGAAGGAAVAGVGALPGAAIGATAGMVEGMGKVSYDLEMNGRILNYLSRDYGVDTADPVALQAAFDNPEIMKDVIARANPGALATAGFDAVSAGVGGRMITQPAKSLAGKVLQGAAEVGTQGALGGAGSVAGSIASREPIQPGDVLLEAVGEAFGPEIVTGAAGVMGERVATKAQSLPKIEEFPPVQGKIEEFPAQPPNPAQAAPVQPPPPVTPTAPVQPNAPQNAQRGDLAGEVDQVLKENAPTTPTRAPYSSQTGLVPPTPSQPNTQTQPLHQGSQQNAQHSTRQAAVTWQDIEAAGNRVKNAPDKASSDAEMVHARSVMEQAVKSGLTAPNGSPVVGVFSTAQGSIYLHTSDGQTRRIKSWHGNTGGSDAGLHGWNGGALFFFGNRAENFTLALGKLKESGLSVSISEVNGKARIHVFDKSQNAWREAIWEDAYPRAVKSGVLPSNTPIEASFSRTPVIDGHILEWTSSDNSGLHGVHPGSPVDWVGTQNSPSQPAPISPAATVLNGPTATGETPAAAKPTQAPYTTEQALDDLGSVIADIKAKLQQNQILKGADQSTPTTAGAGAAVIPAPSLSPLSEQDKLREAEEGRTALAQLNRNVIERNANDAMRELDANIDRVLAVEAHDVQAHGTETVSSLNRILNHFEKTRGFYTGPLTKTRTNTGSDARLHSNFVVVGKRGGMIQKREDIVGVLVSDLYAPDIPLLEKMFPRVRFAPASDAAKASALVGKTLSPAATAPTEPTATGTTPAAPIPVQPEDATPAGVQSEQQPQETQQNVTGTRIDGGVQGQPEGVATPGSTVQGSTSGSDRTALQSGGPTGATAGTQKPGDANEQVVGGPSLPTPAPAKVKTPKPFPQKVLAEFKALYESEYQSQAELDRIVAQMTTTQRGQFGPAIGVIQRKIDKRADLPNRLKRMEHPDTGVDLGHPEEESITIGEQPKVTNPANVVDKTQSPDQPAKEQLKRLEASGKGQTKQAERLRAKIGEQPKVTNPKAKVETPAKAAGKVAAEVKDVAKTEGQRPAKEIKSELIQRLEEAIENAPAESEVVTKGYTLANMKRVAGTDSREKITIEIPGDGTFTVFNTKEALGEVLKRARKISTDSNKPNVIPRVAGTPNVTETDNVIKAYGSPEAAYRAVVRQRNALPDNDPETSAKVYKADLLIQSILRSLSGLSSDRKLEFQDYSERYAENQKRIAEYKAKLERAEQKAAKEKAMLSGSSSAKANVQSQIASEFPELSDIVEVVDTAGQLPDAVKSEAARRGVPLKDLDAVFFDGKVYVNASQFAGDPQKVRDKMIHEVAIHYGLRRAIGAEKMADLAKRIWVGLSEKERQDISKRNRIDLNNAEEIGEEWLAYEAERVAKAEKSNSLWKKIVGQIKIALRQLGYPTSAKLSDSEIAALIAKGKEGASGVSKSGQVRFSVTLEQASVLADMDLVRSVREKFKRVDWSRLAELGTTDNWREAGYIAPGGQLIDLSGKNEGGPSGSRSYDHRELGGTVGMQEAMAAGLIRINVPSGGGTVSIDIAAKPQREQVSKLFELLLESEGDVSLDLQNGLGEFSKSNGFYFDPSRKWSNEYERGTDPDIILEDISTFFQGRKPGVGSMRFSITPAQDAAYMEAAKNGDLETAQRMVDEAAIATGYTTKAYHATHSKNFNVFDRMRGFRNPKGLNIEALGAWFTDDAGVARELYGPTVKAFYLKTSDFLSKPGLGSWKDLYNKVRAVGGVEEYRDLLKKYGVEGIRLEGDMVDGEIQTIHIALESNSAKSADPITRDDSGRIIPLSERFNENRDDIRFSVSENSLETQDVGADIAEELNEFLRDKTNPVQGRQLSDRQQQRLSDRRKQLQADYEIARAKAIPAAEKARQILITAPRRSNGMLDFRSMPVKDIDAIFTAERLVDAARTVLRSWYNASGIRYAPHWYYRQAAILRDKIFALNHSGNTTEAQQVEEQLQKVERDIAMFSVSDRGAKKREQMLPESPDVANKSWRKRAKNQKPGKAPYTHGSLARAALNVVRGTALPKEFKEARDWGLAFQRYIEERLKMLSLDTRKALYREYKGDARAQAEQRLLDYWTGEIELGDLTSSPALQRAAEAFRQTIDELTQVAIDNGLVPEQYTETWLNNKGAWLKRTYLAFDPTADWNYDTLKRRKEKGDAEIARIWTGIESMLKADYPQASPADIEAAMRRLIDRREVEDALGLSAQPMAGSGRRFAVDTGSLIRRKSLPIEVREWMGEIKDPFARGLQSSKWMAQFITRNLTQRKFARLGVEMGVLSTKPEARNWVELYPNVNHLVPVKDEEGKTVQTEDGNVVAEWRQRVDQRHEPLHGFYTSPEFAEALKDFDSQLGVLAKITGKTLAGKAYLKGVGYIKMAKVGLSPYAYMLNTLGGIAIRVGAGALNPIRFRTAIGVVWQADKPLDENATNKQLRNRMQYLMAVKAGVTGQGVMLGDVRTNLQRESEPAALKRAVTAVNSILSDPKGGGAWVRLRDALSDLAQLPGNIGIRFFDDVCRVDAFLHELEVAREAFPNLPEQKQIEWAADRASNIYQTYDRLSPLLRDMSQIGVLGTFVSFKLEMFRNAGWIAAYAKQGITSSNPALRRDGYKKAVGLMAMAMAPYIAALLSRQATDSDDDEVEAFQRWFVPPWDRGEELVILENKGTRKRYVPMGYMLPHYELTRAINIGFKAANDPNPQIAIGKSMSGLLADYFGPGAFVGPLAETILNKRLAGGPVTVAEGAQGAGDRLNYLRAAWAPNIGDPLFQGWMAAIDKKGTYGREYDLSEVVLKLGGIRARTVDVEKNLPFTMREFSGRWRNAVTYANIAKRKFPSDPEKQREAEAYKVRVQDELKTQYRQFYKDVQKLGVTVSAFMKAEKEAVMASALRQAARTNDK